MQTFQNWYGNIRYHLGRHIRSVKCFFVGHDINWGCVETYEPDWCNYCWKDDQQDAMILRDYMTKIFVQIIDHIPEDWGDKLLGWKPFGVKRMPDWWEY